MDTTIKWYVSRATNCQTCRIYTYTPRERRWKKKIAKTANIFDIVEFLI